MQPPIRKVSDGRPGPSRHDPRMVHRAGLPGTGLVGQAGQPLAWYRPRHFSTVAFDVSKRSAIRSFASPSAAASMLLARSTSPRTAAVERCNRSTHLDRLRAGSVRGRTIRHAPSSQTTNPIRVYDTRH